MSAQVHTLLDLHYRPHLKAERGSNGAGDHRNGARGADLVLPVPVGTVVLSESGEQLADLTAVGMRFIAARGGFGERGAGCGPGAAGAGGDRGAQRIGGAAG